MKGLTAFTIDQHLLDKIDELKLKRGTNRSEAMRHIIHEYFKSYRMDIVDDLHNLKRQNVELKLQLQKLTKILENQREEVVTMLLLLGAKDKDFKKQVKDKFPQFWK